MKSLFLLLAVILSCVTAVPASGQMAPQPQPTLTAGFGETLKLEWQSVSGRTYFLQYSEDLESWNYLPEIVSGTGAVISYGIDYTGDKFFVRLRYTDTVTSDPNNDDFDGDGLTNEDELVLYHTDPLNAMTDGVHGDATVAVGVSFTPGYPTPTDAQGATPLAKLQTRRVSGRKIHYPDQSFTIDYYPTETAVLTAAPLDKDSCPTSVRDAVNYGELASAINAISFGGAEDGWVDGVNAFTTTNFNDDEDANYFLEASHQQYRLVLNAPAPAIPATGCKYKVRIARLSRSYNPSVLDYTTSALPGGDPWVDLELTVPLKALR